MIALASDHIGITLKKEIMQYLEEKGVPYQDFGTMKEERCNYPEYAWKAAEAVRTNACSAGIPCCGTGVGISIAANKVKGIRCVVCSDVYSAELSRKHNDTNMLALGSRVVGVDLALMIVEHWLNGTFEGGRHQLRVDQITRIEMTGSVKE